MTIERERVSKREGGREEGRVRRYKPEAIEVRAEAASEGERELGVACPSPAPREAGSYSRRIRKRKRRGKRRYWLCLRNACGWRC